ncbi:MAG: gamma-glutamyl-gamma-aminobutyrate hydrolase family protein [Candidatus Sulfopaludibacter sp.]|nr:gamma-glutamyl-gamma-aminobutyrate hydrolase family protein [Candidatus Sulfopaludibacter sp.]
MKARVLIVYRERPEVEPYAQAIESTGAEPVLEEVRTGVAIGPYDGLVLTGGGDVDPALYGEIASPETELPDPERDAVEAALIDEALARDLPLLGICRGMQLLNVHQGGSLIQHLPTAGRHVRRTSDRSLPAHSVVIPPGTLLARIARTETWQVNSRHHQAVARLAGGFRVCASDPEDGTVEAIELPARRFVLAVQWHPENQALSDPAQRNLFQSFATAL